MPSAVRPVTQKKPKSITPTLRAAPMWRARWSGSPSLVLRRPPGVEAAKIASRSARAVDTGTGAGAAAAPLELAVDIGPTPGPAAAGAVPAGGGAGGAGVVGGPRGTGGGAAVDPPTGAAPTGAAPLGAAPDAAPLALKDEPPEGAPSPAE